MRIDSDNNCLTLEKVEQRGSTVLWRFVAAVNNAGCLAAVYGRAKVHATEETPAQIADFAARRARRFELRLSRGSWLRLWRGRRGCTLVRYRLGQWGGGASLEGRVRLNGRSADTICRELGGLL